MMTKTATALLLAAAVLVAAAPTASAAYNRCTNEADDFDLLNLRLVGYDGPLLTDGNGEQVCLFDRTFSVETTGSTDDPSPPPGGVAAVVRVCHGIGDAADECDTSSGNAVLLDWTGVTLFCRPVVASVCVWANGVPILIV